VAQLIQLGEAMVAQLVQPEAREEVPQLIQLEESMVSQVVQPVVVVVEDIFQTQNQNGNLLLALLPEQEQQLEEDY